MGTHEALVRIAVRKVRRRLIPFLFILYIAAWLDRVNVGFAALQMNTELKFSAEAFGIGSGVFLSGTACSRSQATLCYIGSALGYGLPAS